MADSEQAEAPAEQEVGAAPSAVSVEDLLAAVNAASGQARAMWLGFLGLIAYLFVAIAGVTHKDLLLNSPITLPIVGVEIPLFSFFIFAPALFVLVHLGLLIQHAMLSQKVWQFLKTLNDGVPWGPGPDAMRNRLHAYTQTQLLAGPERSAIVGFFLHIMSWVTIYGLPILLLFTFQLKFLPYHELWVTVGHSLILTIDILIVVLIGIFIARPSASFRDSFRQVKETKKPLFVLSAIATPVVLYLSIFVMTVPNKGMDHFRLERPTVLGWAFVPADWLAAVMFVPSYSLFFAQEPQAPWKVSRNLVLSDMEDLVPDAPWEPDEPSHSLRGRDFRLLQLDRSDLRRADLTGSNLRGASLQATNLAKADLEGADLQEADLVRAELSGAKLSNANLQGANLVEADLQGADLTSADLRDADLGIANLQGANLGGANLQGADLGFAQLQGAFLGLAQLQGADLARADLQGADLGYAQLQGADLEGADLRGADLSNADLLGANLTKAVLQGANLKRARIWQTQPPEKSAIDLADLSGAEIAPLTDEEHKALEQLIDESWGEPTGWRLKDRLGPLLDEEPAHAWSGSQEFQAWADLNALPEPDPVKLSDFLAKLACDETGGYIAKRIASRGYLAFDYSSRFLLDAGFKLLAQGLTRKTCRAAAASDDETKTELCRMADWPDDEIGATICGS